MYTTSSTGQWSKQSIMIYTWTKSMKCKLTIWAFQFITHGVVIAGNKVISWELWTHSMALANVNTNALSKRWTFLLWIYSVTHFIIIFLLLLNKILIGNYEDTVLHLLMKLHVHLSIINCFLHLRIFHYTYLLTIKLCVTSSRNFCAAIRRSYVNYNITLSSTASFII